MLYFLFYLIMCFLFPKDIEMESLIHCFISTFWSWYVFNKYIPISLFSYKSLKNITDYVEDKDIIKNKLLAFTNHSISYFLADSINILISNDSRKIYVFHHIISIIGLSSIYLDTYIGSYAIFLAELGGIAHHIKRLGKKTKKKYFKILLFIFYFFTYSITRFLMITNVIYYSFHIKKKQDIIPILITYPLVFQNLKWLYQNIKKLAF